MIGIAQQLDINYYLPKNVHYNQDIPKPSDIIGHEVGEWHISHDRLVNYMYAISKASDRVTIKETGRTHEGRPLLLLTITSPQNQGKIEEIRKEHLKLSDPSQNGDVTNMPTVVYMGYSIHGNEPSGSNASLLAAYHLAAAEGTEIEELLSNVVILLDPSYNPDGLNRFASWANTNKSKTEVLNINNREQNEAWPGGRTNHYWFDLNRDWLPLQQPESQARMVTFQQWKPNILTDHHEMGSNSTFFFQPGIPSRNNPLTPSNTYVLTEKIAQYHAKALDNIGSLYYSKESFDDFYYGKGSSYPDVNGGVGILFEQASSRGHARNTANGVLKFPFTIKNQFTTTLSTLKAAKELRTELLNHQKEFYKSSLQLAASDILKAYVFDDDDPIKLNEFVRILESHKIEVNKLTKSTKGIGKDGFIVSMNQPQYRLIKAIFEKRTTFQDSLFYDVSAWTLPLAFNLKYAEVAGKSFTPSLVGEKYESIKRRGTVIGEKTNYAYAFEWNNYNAPKLLHLLQSKGIKGKVALTPFTSADGKKFNLGTIIIPVQNQNITEGSLYQFLISSANDTGVDVYALKSGYTSGVNLGSPQIVGLKKPTVAIITGRGVSSYDAGETWHLLDTRMDIPVSRVGIETFNTNDMSGFTTLVMVNGSYGKLDKLKLQNWIQNGGTIIAMKSAANWLSEIGLNTAKFKKQEKDSSEVRKPYGDYSNSNGAQYIGGAIFEASIDATHPISFGLSGSTIPVFRNSTLFMEYSNSSYATPITYSNQPLLSGYISNKNLEKLKKTAVVNVSVFGSGKIISFTDNPNFRAFWYGTNKLFLNSLFFANIINPATAR